MPNKQSIEVSTVVVNSQGKTRTQIDIDYREVDGRRVVHTIQCPDVAIPTLIDALQAHINTTSWYRGLPKHPGNYWFYGWQDEYTKNMGNAPELVYMTAHQTDSGVVCVANGVIYYRFEAIGEHCIVDLPELPDLYR